MITLTKEEAQQVLDALEPIALYKAYNGDDWPARQVMPAIKTLRARLSEHEQTIQQFAEKLAAELRRLDELNAELVAALYLITEDKDGDGFICREAMDVIRAAIAKAEGADAVSAAVKQMVAATNDANKQMTESTAKMRDNSEKLGAAITKLAKIAGDKNFAATAATAESLVNSLERLAELEKTGMLDKVMKAMSK